jgi:preprotein translocase subunit Sec63
MVLAKDLYKILELSPDATENEIKKVFRRLSILYIILIRTQEISRQMKSICM